MTPSDPTEHALAAIASILDHSREHPETRSNNERESGFHFQLAPVIEEPVAGAEPDPEPAVELKAEPEVEHRPQSAAEPDPESAAAPEPVEVATYSKSGPGPFDALRFRWSARLGDDGGYYVDETIGPHSRPLSSGPMSADQVIGFIDERERSARERFDALKREMSAGSHSAVDPGRYGGET